MNASDVNGVTAEEEKWDFQVFSQLCYLPLKKTLEKKISYLGYGLTFGMGWNELFDWNESNAWYPSRPWTFSDGGYIIDNGQMICGAYYSKRTNQGRENWYYAIVYKTWIMADSTSFKDEKEIEKATLEIFWDKLKPLDRDGSISGNQVISYIASTVLLDRNTLFDGQGDILTVKIPSVQENYSTEKIDITKLLKNNIGKYVYFIINRERGINSRWAEGLTAKNGASNETKDIEWYTEDSLWRECGGSVSYACWPFLKIEIYK